jgi:cytochrome P450
MEIPSIFTDRIILNDYDFNELKTFKDTSIDNTYYINNLSNPKNEKYEYIDYYKSLLFGYNHVFISNLLQNMNNDIANINLPLLNDWGGTTTIDNLVIISDPNDAQRICKHHIKKAPIFTNLLNNSIISTTDNEDWKEQRDFMNMGFLPKLSLEKVFPISQKRAQDCSIMLKNLSNNFKNSININDFFLNETQAQLQLAMFGFSDKFEKETNQKIRDVFSGINMEYAEDFVKSALKEASISNGPISKFFNKSDDIEKDIGNMLIYTFAGHDTTGHTLTWLLYELCIHPNYQEELIKEIDIYWENNIVEDYSTFNQLPFMTKCITETLRMWPALANGTFRELEKDDYVIGHNGDKVMLPKGTYCQIINWTRHRSSTLWGEDVNIFNPHREFKNEEIWDYNGFGSYNVSSERYSPFTYGPRNCIGKNFSHMEMRLILLNIFKNYRFQLEDQQSKLVDDPSYMGFNLFTMGPLNIKNEKQPLGMHLHIIPRNSKL